MEKIKLESDDSELKFIKRFADKKHKKEIDYYLLHTIEDLYTKNNYDIYYEKRYMHNMYIYFFIFYEIYRTTVCVFLVIFVPQSCNMNDPCQQPCGFLDNIYVGKQEYDIAMSFSIVTFCFFISLYLIELVRENTLKKYLKYNKYDRTGIPGINNIIYNEEMTDFEFAEKYDFLPNKDPVYNNETIASIRNEIMYMNRVYKYTTFITVLIYIINVILSSIVIMNHNMGMKTYSVLVTYVLIVVPKLTGIYKIIFSNKYKTDCITYSAFSKEFVDYNELKKTYQDHILYDLQNEYIHIYKNMYQFYADCVLKGEPLYINDQLYHDTEWEEYKIVHHKITVEHANGIPEKSKQMEDIEYGEGYEAKRNNRSNFINEVDEIGIDSQHVQQESNKDENDAIYDVYLML